MRSRALKVWLYCLAVLVLAVVFVPFAIAWCGIRGAWRGLAYGVYHYVPTSEVVGMLLYGLRHPMDAAQALEQPETLDA